MSARNGIQHQFDTEPLSLRQRFRALRRHTRPQERGFAFERLLAELLRRHGFQIRLSPRGTRPRQTDLLAHDEELTLLASIKWLRAPIGSSEVDEISARLRRMPRGAVGCLFSMSSIRPTVREEVTSIRAAHEILLFSPTEVAALFEDRLDLREAINAKRLELSIEGRCISRPQIATDKPFSRVDLPVGAGRIVVAGQTHRWLAIPHTGWGDVLFASRLPHATWSARGSGASLQLNFDCRRFEDLVKIVAIVPAAVGLSEDGTFAIHQTAVAWHGFGLQTLFEACRKQATRYRRASGPFHHSEQCRYFAATRTGWAALTFQLDARGSDRVMHCELEVRVPGIPIDMEPYRRLMRQTRREAHFELLDDEREVESARIPSGIRLDVLGLVTYRHERWVRGVVCRNPFRSTAVLLPTTSAGVIANNLRDPETLICTLDQEHEVEDRVDGYWLHRIETIPSAIVAPLELHCDWGRLTHRAADERAKTPGAPTALERALTAVKRRRRS